MERKGYKITRVEGAVKVQGPCNGFVKLRLHHDDAMLLLTLLDWAHKDGERAKSNEIISLLNQSVFPDDVHAGSEKDEKIRKLEDELSRLKDDVQVYIARKAMEGNR